MIYVSGRGDILKKKRKWLAALICLFVFATGVSPAHAAHIVVNNHPLTHLDQEAVIIDGRTFVPLRGVFEVFGEVGWDPQRQTVSVRTDRVGIFMIVGSDYAVCTHYENGYETYSEVVYMERPSWIRNGRVMLPVRFVAESLNANVEWLQSAQTVYIDTR